MFACQELQNDIYSAAIVVKSFDVVKSCHDFNTGNIVIITTPSVVIEGVAF